MKSVKILLFCAVVNILNANATTPLCDLCPCNSEPNNPPHVNCYLDDFNLILNRSYWYNNDEPYQIASLALTISNTTKLSLHFPQSDLKLLDLRGNKLNEMSAGVFGNLQKMEVLLLGNNKLKKINPESFKGIYTKNEYYPLRSLKTLDFKYNKISTLVEDTFAHIDELAVLILSHNPITEIDAQTVTAIASLATLKVLDLSYTNIKTLPSNLLLVCSTLQKLDLSGNRFDAIPKTLEESTSLETLIFNANPIQTLKDENIFPKIESLTILHMSRMSELVEFGPGSLSNLINLKELHVKFNKRLSHVHPHAMMRIERDTEIGLLLQKVFLNDNNISYIDKELFLNFSQIKKLDISGNPLKCGCRNQWLLDDLMPLYDTLNDERGEMLICDSPEELRGKSLYELYEHRISLKCLDTCEAAGEKALVIIGLIAGILMVIIVFLYVIFTVRWSKPIRSQEYHILRELKSTPV